MLGKCLVCGQKIPLDMACLNDKDGGSICLSHEGDLKKVELINTLHSQVVDYDADGETCYYVYVPVDDETIDVLKKLGATDADIVNDARDEQDQIVINLAPYGFKFSKWWHSDTGFSLIEPSD